MKKVRLGVVGVGNMGSSHAARIQKGEFEGCELTAVCDIDPKRMKNIPGEVEKFTDYRKLIRAGKTDGVLIATPHYDHTVVGIAALKAGLHVLVEKPISVHKADCERLIAAHRRKKQVFAAMFNQRTDPFFQKARQLVKNGDLGKITRVNWIITSWFRTECYYATGDWRATWGGEGGGVLLNQCPHQLDLLQWICGMPVRLRAFCGIGKKHNIEVEDEVTAHFEYKSGATGVFITSTGEAPGTNRLEITGDMGKLVAENDTLRFTRNEMPVSKFCRQTKKSFAVPEVWNIEIPVRGHGGQHGEIIRNFVDAIRKGKRLIAPAKEGIHSVELANAMLYSSLTGKPVTFPLDAAAYERRLKKLIRESKFVKKTAGKKVKEDISDSF
ncbi:MAG: Gfo/Idh/MocA family oxidoreductase [Kiritimatiellia bacterium]